MSESSTPSRRSLVRGAAWSVPVVAMAATAPSYAASPCVNKTAPQAVTWSATPTTTRQTGATSGGTTVNVAARHESTLLGRGSIAGSNMSTSGVADPRDSFNLVNNSPTSASLNPAGNYQVVTFSFTREVYGLTFTIDDIDRAPGSYFDHVFLAGAPETPSVTLGSAVTGAGTQSNPWRTTGAEADNSPTQSVTVTYPNGMVPMTSLTLRFYTTVAPLLASTQHVIRIRQMSLRTCA